MILPGGAPEPESSRLDAPPDGAAFAPPHERRAPPVSPPPPPNTGWRRVVNATVNSWAGLKGVWRNEAAFRQESLLCLFLTPVGLWLGRSGVERALLVGSLLLIMIVELLNSGIEAVVDRIGPEWHELSRLAKDTGSAAVFMTLLHAGVVWALVLLTR